MPDPIIVMAVGDVSADLPDNGACFRHVRPLFAEADIVFGNCEYVYSDVIHPAPTHFAMHAAPPSQAAALDIFDVMSLANNHAVDAGYAGLRSTMRTLRDLGVEPVGAGENLAEAQAPAIVDVGNRKVAFLGFCTTFPLGFEARPNRAGLSPLRVNTFYRNPQPNIWDPGIPGVIETVPLAEDVENYRSAIQAAKSQADFVVVAHHWGMNPEVRAMLAPAERTFDRVWRSALESYELELARFGVDVGADAIVAHHQTSLNGIEIRDGKPIYYGLAALVHHFHDGGARSDDAITTDTSSIAGYPHWAFQRPETLITGVAVIALSDDGIEAGLVPAMILPDGGVEPLQPDDPRVPTVIDHLASKIEQEHLDTQIDVSALERWTLLRLLPRCQSPTPAAPVASLDRNLHG